MDADYYERVLYPLQEDACAVIRSVESGLYLTGGTTASRVYLHHRYSDDLDYFANDQGDFGVWVSRVLEALRKEERFRIEMLVNEDRFSRAMIYQDTVPLKLEFVNDVPTRIGQVRNVLPFGLVDTAENILANKVTAALDRNEPKDLADIWGFCTKMHLSLDEAISGAQGKAAGVFPPDLARVLLSATAYDWSAIRWKNAPDPQDFVSELHRLGEALLLPGEMIG
ncbi:MAG: nucleotidyl transferase AbiEii/AbiGii toxin family protein [Ignavibacteria bacterium]|nr:nucleotidyl transferase AbiEii/AbiGii toxin family protein [Ignavibacteria bacterium]